MRVVMLVGLAVGSIAAGGNQDWERADRATRRLAPAAFRELPAPIQVELDRRGCTIPQPFTATKPENVIQGRFTSASRTDWAVLCSRQNVSSILVFRGGASASALLELAPEPDVNSLQTVDGKGTIGYSRVIAVADAKYIQEHEDRYRGAKPPRVDHEGIHDIFIEKGSVVWYWYQNVWLKLQGSD
jgi:hypothetical protein